MRVASSIGLAVVLLPLSACTTPTSYMGVPFEAQARPVPNPKDDLQVLVDAPREYGLVCENMAETSQTCQDAGAQFVTALSIKGRSLDSLPVGELARLASSGDQQAQFELGVRFEEGRGVTCDADKARALYRKAATSTGGTIWVYQAPVGNDTYGRKVPIDSGPRQAGLTIAAQRLQALERRMEHDPRGERDLCVQD